ncbi:hypothetical protein Tco_1133119 [Tanacetum coccineum]|uniref:Uncharacterized protein n=1 Tax=Tanacetum coccineum TaxID=301880 RepID=A0ABQ5JGQ7_9ASTR
MSWKLHGSSGVHTLVTETGLVIHMLVEKRYPLRKKVLMQMLKLKLESEEDSTMALELIRFIKKILCRVKTLKRKRLMDFEKGLSVGSNQPHNKWSLVHHALIGIRLSSSIKLNGLW